MLSFRVEKVIDDWHRERMTNSIVSQNTAVFNHVTAAVADLKTRLAKAIEDDDNAYTLNERTLDRD